MRKFTNNNMNMNNNMKKAALSGNGKRFGANLKASYKADGSVSFDDFQVEVEESKTPRGRKVTVSINGSVSCEGLADLVGKLVAGDRKKPLDWGGVEKF